MGFEEVGKHISVEEAASLLMSFPALHAMVSEPRFPHLCGEINTASPDSLTLQISYKGLEGECSGFQAPHFCSEVQSKGDTSRPAIRTVLIQGGLG